MIYLSFHLVDIEMEVFPFMAVLVELIYDPIFFFFFFFFFFALSHTYMQFNFHNLKFNITRSHGDPVVTNFNITSEGISLNNSLASNVRHIVVYINVQ